MSSLAGARILLVEDEYLIAEMAGEMLAELGAVVVGPAYHMRDGLTLARGELLDAAVLDVNIHGETSDAIAGILQERDIPYVLATGYGEAAVRQDGVPVLDKPYDAESLATVLRRALARV
jgi:CheY-like chemotaxis protein